jgi:hypothetical protein
MFPYKLPQSQPFLQIFSISWEGSGRMGHPDVRHDPDTRYFHDRRQPNLLPHEKKKKVAGFKERDGLEHLEQGWNRVGTPRCFGSPAPRNPEFPEIEGGWTPQTRDTHPLSTRVNLATLPRYRGVTMPAFILSWVCRYYLLPIPTPLLGGYMVKWSSVSMFGGCVWHGPLEEERAEV